MAAQIAIFDSDDTLLRVLQDAVESEGLPVVMCRSLLEVHQAAARGATLAIVDAWGPGHCTLGDSERQQLMDLGRLVPTVLITGRSWAGTVRAGDLGLVAILPKPFDLKTLLDIAKARVRLSESESGARTPVNSAILGVL